MNKEEKGLNPEYIRNLILNLSKSAAKAQPVLRQIAEFFKYFVKNAPENLILLSKYGWYIDPDLTPIEILTLGEYLKNGEQAKVDKSLSSYFRENLVSIWCNLSKNNPDRKELFNQASYCFDKKKYSATIVLLLTQVDGICYDRTKKLFFKNNQKLAKKQIYKPEFEESIREGAKGLLELTLSPFSESTTINDNWNNNTDWPVRLNRHEIIHGIDIHYGNEINALKIISLTYYIDDITKKIE